MDEARSIFQNRGQPSPLTTIRTAYPVKGNDPNRLLTNLRLNTIEVGDSFSNDLVVSIVMLSFTRQGHER